MPDPNQSDPARGPDVPAEDVSPEGNPRPVQPEGQPASKFGGKMSVTGKRPADTNQDAEADSLDVDEDEGFDEHGKTA